jgi:hypothetical protein
MDQAGEKLAREILAPGSIASDISLRAIGENRYDSRPPEASVAVFCYAAGSAC